MRKLKVAAVFGIAYIVTAALCIKTIRKVASKALDEEYKHLVENYKL